MQKWLVLFFEHRKVLIICNFFLLFHAFAAYFCEKICIKFDDAKKFQWMLKNPTVKINLAAHLTLSCFDSFIMLDPQCSKICKKVKFKKIVSIFFNFPNSPHWNFFFINLVYLIKPCSYNFFLFHYLTFLIIEHCVEWEGCPCPF